MLHKIEVAGSWLHVVWIVSLIGMVLVLVFGSETMRRQAGDIYIVRTLWLLAAALVAISGLRACGLVVENLARRAAERGSPW